MPLKDKYEYISLIGSGYFSDVKYYRDRSTKEEVAIKELKHQFLQNIQYVNWFKREIEILNILKGHPNIIRLLDEHISQDQLYYIMPKATTNLSKFIKTNNQKLNYQEKLAIFDQVIQAIKYAHSKGIIHRDISPNNVLLFNKNDIFSACVSDFGLGKNLLDDSHSTRSDVSEFGQPFYVAPEQREKLKTGSINSDIYSLGKLLYFILTGRDPDMIHLTNFSSLINKAIENDPNSRHRNIEEFEAHYEKLKELILFDDKPDQIYILGDLVTKKGQIDWKEFHKVAVRGDYHNHVYSDYLKPILEILSSEDKISDYYSEVGDAIHVFICKLTDQIDVCTQTVGWPFTATESFGILLYNLFNVVENDNSKLRCLQALWDLAYVKDQWRVKGRMNSILTKGGISDEIQVQFAFYIQESQAIISPDQFSDQKIPAIIRKALISKFSSVEEVKNSKY